MIYLWVGKGYYLQRSSYPSILHLMIQRLIKRKIIDGDYIVEENRWTVRFYWKRRCYEIIRFYDEEDDSKRNKYKGLFVYIEDVTDPDNRKEITCDFAFDLYHKLKER